MKPLFFRGYFWGGWVAIYPKTAIIFLSFHPNNNYPCLRFFLALRLSMSSWLSLSPKSDAWTEHPKIWSRRCLAASIILGNVGISVGWDQSNFLHEWTIYILVVGTDKGTMREQIPEGLFWSTGTMCFCLPQKAPPSMCGWYWIPCWICVSRFEIYLLSHIFCCPCQAAQTAWWETSRHVVMCQSEFFVLIIICVNCRQPQMTSLELLRSKLLTRIPHGGLKESNSMWKELMPEPFLGEIRIHLPILSSIMKDIIQPPCWKVEGIHSWR